MSPNDELTSCRCSQCVYGANWSTLSDTVSVPTFTTSKTVRELNLPVAATKRECVRVCEQPYADSGQVRTQRAVAQTGGWTGQQTLLVAELARVTLLGYDSTRQNAKL